MDPKEFDQKLVDKIREEKMTPRPRWHFLLKNYVVWAAGALSLLVGAAAISVMIYLLKYNGWELREETHKSILEFFLLTLPYFWFIFLGIFVFILYYNLKHTKKGYRYSVGVIVMAGVLASIVLGSIFYLFGVGQKIDNVLGEKAPLYETVINPQMFFWFNPSEGRLAGVVAGEVVDNSFYLVDPAGNAWRRSNRDAGDMRVPGFLKAGEPINLVGEVTGDNKFRADIIRPLVPGRHFFDRPAIRARHDKCLEDDCLLPFVPENGGRPAAGDVIRIKVMPEDAPPLH